MKNLLTLTILLTSSQLFGQKIIELKNKPIELMARNFNIIKVVDSRVDTTIIGIFKTGFNDSEKENVIYNQPLSSTLMGFLNNSLPKINSSNSIILQVNKFAVNQYIAYTKVGFSTSKVKRQFAVLEARLSYFLKSGDEYLKLLERDYSFEEKGISVGNKHSDNVYSLFKESLSDLEKTGFNAQEKEKLSWADIARKKSTFPILTTTQLKKGIYMSFLEFRNNEPSVTNIEVVANPKDSTFQLMFISEAGTKKAITADTKIWGFSDGQNSYFKQKSYYFDLVITDKDVTFTGFDYYSLLRRNIVGPMIKSAVLMGLTGGLLRNGVTDLVSALVLSDISRASNSIIAKMTIDNVSKQTLKTADSNIHIFKINMDNGEFIQKD